MKSIQLQRKMDVNLKLLMLIKGRMEDRPVTENQRGDPEFLEDLITLALKSGEIQINLEQEESLKRSLALPQELVRKEKIKQMSRVLQTKKMKFARFHR